MSTSEVWEPETIDLLRGVDPEGDVIHAGAYFGDFLPAIARSRAPGATIWAFEPNPENYRCAQITVLLNDLRNVTLVPAALGSTPGRGLLVTADPSGVPLGGGSYIVAEHLAASQALEEVNVVAIDDVVSSQRRVAAIQLDVEGHDVEALNGARRTVERCRPLIVIEVCPGVERSWPLLGGLGYEVQGWVHSNVVLAPRCG